MTDQVLNNDAIVAVTKLHASKPWKDFYPLHRAARSQQYSVASFATLRVLSCLHSPGLRCLCYNVARFCCDHVACNLVTATTDGIAIMQLLEVLEKDIKIRKG
jgi:hypothetical protein